MQINAYTPPYSSAYASPYAAASAFSSSQETAQPTTNTAEAKTTATSNASAAADEKESPSSVDTSGLRKLSAEDIAALDQQAANDATAIPSVVVYAEIWKDGVKVSEVYADGRTSTDLSVDGAGGAISAQIRAQQLANELGGQVRYPGQEIAKAERMRSQLRAAYGV